MQNGYTCPVCGTKDKTKEPGHFFNVTAIQSETAWARIELDDDEISALARGVRQIVLIPAPQTLERSQVLEHVGLALDKMFVEVGVTACIDGRWADRDEVVNRTLDLMLRIFGAKED